jgi:NhaA family Na+:H+ antiporter
LAGVGFTMSLFVTKLAYINETLVLQAKLGVISASIIAGIGGVLLLKLAIKKQLKASLN